MQLRSDSHVRLARTEKQATPLLPQESKATGCNQSIISTCEITLLLF
jgi:hypothetical protein